MNMMKRPARLGFAAALFALLLGPLVFGAQSALAQVSLPAGFYGTGNAGSTIGASIGGEDCGSTVATSEGWLLEIAEGDCGGNAGEGATVNFTIDGEAAAETAEWTAGYTEVSLTVAPPEPDDGMGEGENGMEKPDDGMGEGENGMKTPDPSDVGNAGFATGSGSTSPLLALALGVLALAGVAGARTVTGRVS